MRPRAGCAPKRHVSRCQDCRCGLTHLSASPKTSGSVAGTNLLVPVLGSPVPRLGWSPPVEDVLELLAKVAAELKGSGWQASMGCPEPPSVQVW